MLPKATDYKERMVILNNGLNNYKHKIKFMDDDKLIPREQHFCLNDHHVNREAKFAIKERIEKIKKHASDSFTITNRNTQR